MEEEDCREEREAEAKSDSRNQEEGRQGRKHTQEDKETEV